MIKLRGGAVSVSARRLGGTLALAAASAVTLLALVAPPGAAASYVGCHASMGKDDGTLFGPVANGILYKIDCDVPVHAYSIISTSPVDFFGVAPLVYTGRDTSSDVDGNGSFSCEGPFGGKGFGCNGGFTPGTTPPVQGGAATHHLIVGQMATEDRFCAKHHQPRPHAWVTVETTQNDAGGNPYAATSEPFFLKRDPCTATGKHHHHHHHHHR